MPITVSQLPSFIPYLATFFMALGICVCLHLFIRSRSLFVGGSSRSSQSEEMDPSNCLDLIRRQMLLLQTLSHPSPQGREAMERLAELLLGARMYFPSSKDQLEAFASRLREVYDDEGFFLMALMDLRKWMNENLQQPELG